MTDSTFLPFTRPDIDAATIAAVGYAIEEELRALMPLSPDALCQQRADPFYAIGRSLQ